ncbi:Predicted O-linked N-acetylglucosamine transferase, SPINDLY family [Arboricoccus pini]|uniref:protein O-GlcNAc transferase n=2 Tax=Arboricoccus pini TaxID=1963835 RepID=A0A212RUI0_9PROT|nr:Predicted O-linked N-acetylglucosamine transferase, SPINDLY family [Arboricoccus pini]
MLDETLASAASSASCPTRAAIATELLAEGHALIQAACPLEGIEVLRRALALDPTSLQAHAALGQVLTDQGDLPGAFAVYEAALALDPDHYLMTLKRADLLVAAGFKAEALAAYDRALAIAPRLPAVLSNRGNVLRQLGRFEAALADHDEAVAGDPLDGGLWCNRAAVLGDLGHLDEALASYDRALACRPDHPVILTSRGFILGRLGRFKEALDLHERALALDPGYAVAWRNLAVTLNALKRFQEAAAAYLKALELKPGDPDILFGLANLFMLLERREAAYFLYERLVKVAPDFPFAQGLFFDARLLIGNWQDHDAHVARLEAGLDAARDVVLPFDAMTWNGDPARELALASAYVARHFPAQPALWRGERYGHERLRIAYVGHDFHEHVTPHLMAGVFESHDRARFETFAISQGQKRDQPMRRRLEGAFDHFLDLAHLTAGQVASLMRAHEIDIAIDLKGHTHASEWSVMAHRPAPLQVNFLAFPGTTGAPYLDYILADAFIIPEANRRFFSEKVVHLPISYQPNDRHRVISRVVPTRKAAGLPPTGFVFCSFNKSTKINPAIFDIWMRLLRAVEGSVLWLLAGGSVHADHMRCEAETRGVDANRLVFAPSVPPADHLARMRLADLFLDTLPFNAHTTASDALWAGLPLLTCAGRTFAARAGGSIVHAAGLPELVTHSLAAYEEVARALALDPARCAALKERLEHARSASPLFDTVRFTAAIERAFSMMQARHEAGLPPAHFSVPG